MTDTLAAPTNFNTADTTVGSRPVVLVFSSGFDTTLVAPDTVDVIHINTHLLNKNAHIDHTPDDFHSAMDEVEQLLASGRLDDTQTSMLKQHRQQLSDRIQQLS